MTPPEPLPPNLRADAFVGTARAYARYRLPYPRALLADLMRRAGVTGDGRLMDLACGPGRVGLALAGSFREVWASDLEPEMVAMGREEAQRRGVANVRWSVGRAEEVEAPPGSFEMITIGEAFHRLDQRVVTEKAFAWLATGGCLVTLGGDGVFEGAEAWQGVVQGLVRQWTGLGTSRPGAPVGLPAGSGPEDNERVLRGAGFLEVDSYSFVETQVLTIEAIAGYLSSTSYCSRRALGPNADAFEAELRAALLAHDPSGLYRQAMGFGYTLGRKP